MSTWSDLRAAAVLRIPAPVRRCGTEVGRLAALTFKACFRYRVTGLAAEAAFFAILSLPPLIFGLAGAIGFVAQQFRTSTVANFQTQILALASRVLNPESVQEVIAPTLTDVLSAGRYSVISIGFILALWSGSRALNVFFDTITIMYGQGGVRSLVRSRLLSFVSYLIFLLLGVVLIPLVLAGPSFVDRLLPERLEAIGLLYWPVMLCGSVLFLIALYEIAVPGRSRWRVHLPGAALSLVIWAAGSALLRFVLGISSGSTTIYGPLAAPIAVLIWLYLMSLAVLIGAALNAAAGTLWPGRFGAGHPERAVEPGSQPGSQPGPEAGSQAGAGTVESPLQARLAAGLTPDPTPETAEHVSNPDT